MRFTMKCIEETGSGTGIAPTTHTSEFQCDSLQEVLMHTELFLRGCGFYLENLDCDLPSIGCRDNNLPEREPF
jgi:hypothetical protein